MFEWLNIQSFVSIRFSKYNYNNKKYRNKQHNSMVLAQKQTHRSTEQNREPRNKPTHYGQVTYDNLFSFSMEKRQSPQ